MIQEYSSTASLATFVKGTNQLTTLQKRKDDPGGFQDPKKKKKRKRNEDLCDAIVAAILQEVVKKKGGVWKLYDDSTGAELGSYRDRKAAWTAQRIKRQQAKFRNQQTKHKKHNHPKKVQHAKFRHHEQFAHAVAQALLEASPYVFEQSPTSEDSLGWDAFVSRLSHEVLQSDPKLKNILVGLYKTRIKVLQLAYKQISDVLHKTGQFEVDKAKTDKQEDGEPVLMFDINILAAKKKVPIGIVIQHDKPVFRIPDETKAFLNSLATQESKLLRAELMHVQETVLDNIHDVTKAAEKRNNYLKNMESKMDKMLSSMVPLQIALLRNLIKSKYKGMK